jgi:hypothetical protein
MTAVTVSPTGRLTASSETIAALKRLCSEDAAMLDDVRPMGDEHLRRDQDVVLRVAPLPSDDEIEALLGSSMVTVYSEAQKSFALAPEHTARGQLAEMRDIHIHRGARLTRAYAD